MVRFIIVVAIRNLDKNIYIYIPIWLDLLLMLSCQSTNYYENLHSNMVRFIIHRRDKNYIFNFKDLHSNMVRFIIQTKMDKMELVICNLHSNMVRFII